MMSGSLSNVLMLSAQCKSSIKRDQWNARVLLADLREKGYDGGYTLLTDWLRPVREAARAGIMREWETPPGVYACADWGRLGRLEVQTRRRLLWP